MKALIQIIFLSIMAWSLHAPATNACTKQRDRFSYIITLDHGDLARSSDFRNDIFYGDNPSQWPLDEGTFHPHLEQREEIRGCLLYKHYVNTQGPGLINATFYFAPRNNEARGGDSDAPAVVFDLAANGNNTVLTSWEFTPHEFNDFFAKPRSDGADPYFTLTYQSDKALTSVEPRLCTIDGNHLHMLDVYLKSVVITYAAEAPGDPTQPVPCSL